MSDRAISLEDYALVRAGIDAGLPLRRALENAKVPPREWGPSAIHWEDALDERNADPELAMAYELALLKATERFEPMAEPIASSPVAWGTFRRHVVASTDPAAFLAKRGMDLAMFGRLEGIWSDRADEPGVAEALREADSGPLGPCPRVEIVMSPLAELGAAPARRAKATASDSSAAAKPELLSAPKGIPVVEAIDELPTFMRPENRMAPLPEPAIPVSSPTAPLPVEHFQPPPHSLAQRTSPLNATAIAPDMPLAQTTPFAPAPPVAALSKTVPMDPVEELAPRTSRIPTVSSGTIVVDPRMVEEALRPLPFDGKGR